MMMMMMMRVDIVVGRGEDGYGVMMFYCLIKFKEILHF
jgi:hypothetical protein